MLSYISVTLLLIGMFGLIFSTVWTVFNHNYNHAKIISILSGVSVILMINASMLLYIVVHVHSLLGVIISITAFELLSVGGFFLDRGITNSFNKPDLVDKMITKKQ